MKTLKLIPFLLLFAACAKPEAPQAVQPWHPWEWAKCLPSVSNTDCPGEKPSLAILQHTGILCWTYEIEGERRTEVIDGETWLIYPAIYCLNASGNRTGKTFNVGFKNIPYLPHPITGKFWEGDDQGPTSGTFTILGYMAPDGTVRPSGW